jgi:drug/metabolite transporter (DMT)-like permease
MGNYIILATSISLAVLGQLLMKKGMMMVGSFPISQLAQKIIPMFMNPFVFFGFVSFGISSVFWLVVLSRFEISLVYPMVSIAYILVAFFSWIFFKENLSLIRISGIVAIMIGVYLISRS